MNKFEDFICWLKYEHREVYAFFVGSFICLCVFCFIFLILTLLIKLGPFAAIGGIIFCWLSFVSYYMYKFWKETE